MSWDGKTQGRIGADGITEKRVGKPFTSLDDANDKKQNAALAKQKAKTEQGPEYRKPY